MAEIPEQVQAFLAAHIQSVEQVEILLLLRRAPDKEWSAKDVSRALSTHPASAAARLTEFSSKGMLVANSAQHEPHYRYQPGSVEIDSTIAELADAYSKYRVRVISLIYSKPIDNIRTLADAFKFRKEDQ